MEITLHPLRRIISLLTLAGLAAFLLQGCHDNIVPSYVNRLPYSITIIEDGDTKHPITLEPNKILQGGFGSTPRSIEVLTSTGKIIGTYQVKKLPVSVEGSPKDYYCYLVVDSDGAHIERKSSALGNASDQIR